jgi:hypothetical protein
VKRRPEAIVPNSSAASSIHRRRQTPVAIRPRHHRLEQRVDEALLPSHFTGHPDYPVTPAPVLPQSPSNAAVGSTALVSPHFPVPKIESPASLCCSRLRPEPLSHRPPPDFSRLYQPCGMELYSPVPIWAAQFQPSATVPFMIF